MGRRDGAHQMMPAHISNFWKMPVATVFGGVMGVAVVLFAPLFVAPLTAAWDTAFPVIEPVESRVIERDGDSLLMSITARKRTGEECTLVRLYGYSVDRMGVYQLAQVRRPDGTPQAGIIHGKGLYDFGVWRIKPFDASDAKVIVYVEHNCLGRIIKSKLAEADL